MTTQTPIPDNTAGTQSVSTYEIRFTNPEGFIEELKADLAAGHVQDNILRLATRKAHAIMADVEPDRAFDHRPAVLWRTHYVEASYISTRHQLVKLSAFAGVAYEGEVPETAAQWIGTLTEATRRELLRTMRKIQAAIARVEDLDVRGGGLFVEEGVWVAAPGTAIEAPEAVTCATCGVKLHWANNQFRDETGAFQVLVDQQGRFGPIKAIGHIHDPIEAGRNL